MRNCYHGDYLKSYLPAKPAIFIYFFIVLRVGILALEILDTSLLLGYTLIGHGVYNNTKASDN